MGQRISNRQIVEELQKGERSGCAHLMEEYQHRLFDHLVRTFNIPREDAEELVSDVLLLVVRGISSFSFRRSDEDFAHWVFTILRNKVRDFIRYRNRYRIDMETFSEGERKDGEEEKVDTEVAQSIVRDFMAHEHGDGENGSRPMQLVVEVLQSMETWERVILRCRALDIPYEDIAPYIEKPAKQLKIYHLRAKRKFAARLRAAFAENNITMRVEQA